VVLHQRGRGRRCLDGIVWASCARIPIAGWHGAWRRCDGNGRLAGKHAWVGRRAGRRGWMGRGRRRRRRGAGNGATSGGDATPFARTFLCGLAQAGPGAWPHPYRCGGSSIPVPTILPSTFPPLSAEEKGSWADPETPVSDSPPVNSE
jgi:hypothetical protein